MRFAALISTHVFACVMAAAFSSCDQPLRDGTGADLPSKQLSEAKSVGHVVPNPEPFKVEIKASADEREAGAVVYFIGRYAVEFVHGSDSKPEAIYDLEEMSWRDRSPLGTLRLADCQAWAKASAGRSRASIARTTDPELRRFIELMLDPQFKVTTEEDRVILINDVLMYEIHSTQTLSKANRDRFFSYDTLNAYRKAMVERKLPPTPQLEIDKEMAARKLVPSEIICTITTPNGKLRLKINLQVGPMSAEETGRMESLVLKQNTR